MTFVNVPLCDPVVVVAIPDVNPIPHVNGAQEALFELLPCHDHLAFSLVQR